MLLESGRPKQTTSVAKYFEKFEDCRIDMLDLKLEIDEIYFIEKFFIGLYWNIQVKLWEFRSPAKILFEAYLRANFEETLIKKVEAKENQTISSSANTLEDKGDLLGKICHRNSSDANCQMEEEIVGAKNNEDVQKACELMMHEKVLSMSKEDVVKVFDNMSDKETMEENLKQFDKDDQITTLAIDTLEDKGNLREESCHRSSSLVRAGSKETVGGNSDVDKYDFKPYSNLFTKWIEDASDSSAHVVNIVDNEIKGIVENIAHESAYVNSLSYEYYQKIYNYSMEALSTNNSSYPKNDQAIGCERTYGDLKVIKHNHVFDEMFHSQSMELNFRNNYPLEMDETYIKTSFDSSGFILEIENRVFSDENVETKTKDDY
ncbi:hypothetical protein ACH5RR_019222 [Cinchona calisaya]|uniref:Uncharacterized protein n=1 Tax=Cinchona calisaya TaxID=153742 RepID=A0ABD2ZTY4_9GENT